MLRKESNSRKTNYSMEHRDDPFKVISPSASNSSIPNVYPNLAQNEAVSTQESNNKNPQFVSLTQSQFSDLLGNIGARRESNTTFSSCSARFNGGRNTTKVEDFIATILVFKEAENISDSFALLSLPLLLEGYASTWWQGVRHEAKTFNDAIELLRNAFSPPKPDWRIFSEIFQDKQKLNESTDAFICKKRRLFAQLKEKLNEKTTIHMINGCLFCMIVFFFSMCFCFTLCIDVYVVCC